MQQCFAQISDPHLSSLEQVNPWELFNKRALGYLSWRRKRRFEHRGEVLQALQRNLDLAQLDQLLVTGDLTHIGLPSEFQQASAWLQQLGEPQHVALVPGNHDSCVRADWQQTYGLWQDYMASDQAAGGGRDQRKIFPSLRVRGQLAFIGLSTACPKPPLMASGTVDQQQLEALPHLLQDCANRGLFRVLYLHHCPLPGLEKWRKRLTNASAVQDIIAAQGAELVLHGHGHRAHFHEMATTDGTVPVIAVPSASALGLHGADTARYNRYTVEADDDGWQLGIEQRCYDPESGEFTPGEQRQMGIRRPQRPLWPESP